MFEKFYRMMNELTLDMKTSIDNFQSALHRLKEHPGSVDEDIENTLDRLMVIRSLDSFLSYTSEPMLSRHFSCFVSPVGELKHDFEKHLDSLYNKRATPVQSFWGKKGAPFITSDNVKELKHNLILAIVKYPLDDIDETYEIIQPYHNNDTGATGYRVLSNNRIIKSSSIVWHTFLPDIDDVGKREGEK